MLLFRFSNKKELKRRNIIIYMWCLLAITIIILYVYNILLNGGFIYFIFSLLLFGYIQLHQNKYKHTIEQLVMDENKCTLSFFHKMRDAVIVSSEKISFNIIDNEKIEILNKENSEVIGVAEKKYAVDINTWEELCNVIKYHHR